MAGDEQTGVCIMQMDEGLDTGPVLAQTAVPIAPEDSAQSLEQLLADQGAQLLINTLRKLPIAAKPQPTDGACYAPKLTAADRQVDWQRSAGELDLQVRALSDRMPVRCNVGERLCKFFKPRLESKITALAPLLGTIKECTKAGIAVQCGSGELLITQLKLNKGKGLAMDAADAINGYGATYFDPARSSTELTQRRHRHRSNMPTSQQNNKAADTQVIAQVCRGLVQVVIHRRTLDWLRSNQEKLLATPLHQELLYGTTRHYFSLSKLVSEYLAKPLRSKDQDLYALLLVGAYQLRYSHRPDHAVVNGAVNTCATLGKPWARGLINGVLRKIQRNLNAAPEPEADQANHPDWLVRKITAQYPENSSGILAANDQRGPMVLRVNTRKIALQDYCLLLDQQGIGYALSAAPNSLVLAIPQTAASLPHWQDGFVAVQELSAQFPSALLLEALSAGLHNPVVFDACSAPGGKLLQLHEGLCRQFFQPSVDR